MKAILYYIHDPMCSWCWGYKPTWDKLKAALPSQVTVTPLLGGLAPDNTEPMSVAMQQNLQQIWRQIEAKLGTRFNHEFWRQASPVRTTYPACRAVIAAQMQQQGEAMNEAIQQAYYLRAMTPHTEATHTLLAKELGLDVEQFLIDRKSERVEQEFARQRAQCQALGIASFPTLVLQAGEQYHLLELDYLSEVTTLNHIQAILNTL
ncbi:DsbA family protein [Vibrio aphrogenes]|uniref:DsbA family protein n=1 Tax=Vibrio aphrogenes TaxID=1891186 RepID=UPI000B35DBAF|nr:DsbA family protein [Vibrio aphrogenes]